MKRLAVSHYRIQPVLVWVEDDTDEFPPGPTVEPHTCTTAGVQELLASMPEQLVKLAQQAAQQGD